MDKAVFKALLRDAGIPTTRAVVLRSATNAEAAVSGAGLPLPVFVKPACGGSSVGVAKVKRAEDLTAAVEAALRYDERVLVEEGIDARELECAVLGNDDPKASVPGEIVPGHEFYDYDDKYRDDKAKLLIPAPVSAAVAEEARRLAVAVFRLCGVSGMARVDFFLERGTDRVLVNEINTLPGFTAISMYPKLWEASGLPLPRLLDELIRLALERQERRGRLLTEPPAELG
jgi:D-alanine-D-alanine ligase